MNELLPEYPKRIVVSCYCPNGKWRHGLLKATLCASCTKAQAFFDAQYQELSTPTS